MTTSGSFDVTSATANFTSADVDAPVKLSGGSPGINSLTTTIFSVNSSTSVTLYAIPSSSSTGVTMLIMPSPTTIRTALEGLSNIDPGDVYVFENPEGSIASDYEIWFGRTGSGFDNPASQWHFPHALNLVTINSGGLTGYSFGPETFVRASESYNVVENSEDGTKIDTPSNGANVQWNGINSDNNIFRQNIIAHHPEWTFASCPTCNRGRVGTVKGFMELKGGTNTHFDGNIMAGEGTGCVCTVRNQGDGGSSPWSEISGRNLPIISGKRRER